MKSFFALSALALVALQAPSSEAGCYTEYKCTTGWSGAKCCHSPNFSTSKPTIEHIILHFTAGQDSGDLSWLTNPASGVSAHYLVMRNGTVFQLVDETKAAWHAGDSKWGSRSSLNSYSIGIEISNDGSQAYLDTQYTNIINLCKDIIRRYNVKSYNIIGHQDIAPTRKSDPGKHFNWQKLSQNGVGLWVTPVAVGTDTPLSVGSSGTAVSNLQGQLIKYGYGYVTKDGIYGSITESVVKAFQTHFRQAKVDGKADQSTIKTLDLLVAAKG